MYEVSTPEVIILKHVREDPLAAARLERMLEAIRADRIVEVDEDGLVARIQAHGWDRLRGRTGQHRMTRQPVFIFGAFRWVDASEEEELTTRYPLLAHHLLLGLGAWRRRDHQRQRITHRCVCQSAWDIHCAYGCLHACDYCHVAPYFNIMLNLEELAARVREFGETIPEQNLYKFDNYTDTITLEPEYGASETMVRAFADWPGRYLMLYTKSDNVGHLLHLEHNGHTLVSWSLNCDRAVEGIERSTPSLERRLNAMAQCENAGYRVRARLSPMCPVKEWRGQYRDLVERLLARVTPEVISVDVVGWMSPAQMQDALDLSLFDPAYADVVRRGAREGVPQRGKHLFPHDMRADILRFVIQEIKRLRPEQPVSLCMETTDMWDELGPLTGMTPDHYACCCGPTSVPGHPLFAGA